MALSVLLLCGTGDTGTRYVKNYWQSLDTVSSIGKAKRLTKKLKRGIKRRMRS